jgi:GldM C-terminal domain
MKNTLFASLGVVLLCSFCFVIGKKMTVPIVCVSGLFQGNKVAARFLTPFKIVAAQEGPVLASQVKIRPYSQGEKLGKNIHVNATIQGDSGMFYINTDTVGLFELTVETKSGNESQILEAIPFPNISTELGNHTNGSKLGVGEFRAQMGVRARIIGTDMEASCEVLGFQIIRISRENEAQRAINQGGSITKANRPIFDAATPGDIYWFRNIRYRCPGAETPQLATDFSIEIK